MATVPNLEQFPAELKALRRWVTWRYVTRGGKTTKPPLQSIKKPDQWLCVFDACALAAKSEVNGVGFVLCDGVVGIDLDGCIDEDGTLHEIARDALALKTYAELSPSGHGLHIWIKGRIPRSRNIGGRDRVPRREIYDGHAGSARYLTVTGNRFGDVAELRGGSEAQAALDAFYEKWFCNASALRYPAYDVEAGSSNLSDEDVLRLMFEASSGAKWRRLFDGDCSGHPSQSEADFALCRGLRFYTRADRAQIDRLFRRSGLMRPKWDQRRGDTTYGERTIAEVLSAGGRLYRGPCMPYRAGASEGRFGKVHESVLPVLARMTKTDIVTYIGVAMHANRAGECFPSAAEVARLCGSTREHTQRSIGNLGRAGLLPATKRPGGSSKFHLPAYRGVSKFDTGKTAPADGQRRERRQALGKRRKVVSRERPVSEFDTAPASKLDTQTDKEQNIDTGEREDGSVNKKRPTKRSGLFWEPCVPLRPSARDLRDQMLRGPVGQYFVKDDGGRQIELGT